MSFAPAARAFLLRHGQAVQVAFTALFLAGAAFAWTHGRGLAFLPWLLAAVFGAALIGQWLKWQRERFLREAPLPQYLKRKLRDAYPHLSQKDAALVERGLRQFFLACHRSRNRFVAMPSRVVDAMWHDFILHTRAYRDWCALGLGRFLHHTPAEVLGASAPRNDGLRRAWFWACKDEAIHPRSPTRLPLLFALDAKLEIDGGFRYESNCKGFGAGEICATAFGNPVGGPGDWQYFGGAVPQRKEGGDGGCGGGSSCGGDGGGGGDGGCGGGCGGGGGGD